MHQLLGGVSSIAHGCPVQLPRSSTHTALQRKAPRIASLPSRCRSQCPSCGKRWQESQNPTFSGRSLHKRKLDSEPRHRINAINDDDPLGFNDLDDLEPDNDDDDDGEPEPPDDFIKGLADPDIEPPQWSGAGSAAGRTGFRQAVEEDIEDDPNAGWEDELDLDSIIMANEPTSAKLDSKKDWKMDFRDSGKDGSEIAADSAAESTSEEGAAPPRIYPERPERCAVIWDMLRTAGVEDWTCWHGPAKGLIENAEETLGPLEVFALQNDTRILDSGDLFFAYKGAQFDGHDYIWEAMQEGASVVIAEEVSDDLAEYEMGEEGTGVPIILVSDCRKVMAAMAVDFYNDPSTQLRVVGVTGTNGKTTTSWLIRGIFEEMAQLTGMIGTIEYALGEDRLDEEGNLWETEEEDVTIDRDLSSPFHLAPYEGKYELPGTTPDALQVQKVLSGMVDRGAQACVMECSSHGLDQGRLDNVDIDVAVFTNLTHDHLDYHGTMDEYLAAKTKLFQALRDPTRQRAVINIDDPYADAFREAAAAVPIVTYAMVERSADVWVEKYSVNIWEAELIVKTPLGRLQIITPLIGKANAYNVLAAIAVGLSLKAPLKAIVAGIEATDVVPGRMEIIDEKQSFGVVVDYAHTPDALSRLLDTVREAGAARILLVFGCGGDRDKTKRAAMGEVAHYKANIVILTNDNPRGEKPEEIIRDIVAGYPDKLRSDNAIKVYPGGYLQDFGRVSKTVFFSLDPWDEASHYKRFVVEDRWMAIRWAIGTAKAGDVVVIAGKGHEDYQEWMIEGELVKGWFDDRVEARNALTKLPYLDSIPYLDRSDLPWVEAGESRNSMDLS